MERRVELQLDIFDPDAFANNENRPKKRTLNPNGWRRSKAKQARVNGTELKNEAGETIVKAKSQRNVECICGCSQALTEVDKEFIYEQFYTKSSHELQNEYLRGCTEVAGIQTLKNGKERRVFNHKLHFERRTVPVCQNFFLAVHGITRARLRKKVLNREVTIEDRRGKHSGHKWRTFPETRELMRIFLNSLPARQSHYSLNKNPGRLYMDSHWTITALFEEFLKHFPEVIKEAATLIVFRHIFNTEFNIKFGFPRTDKCDKCSSFLCKLSSLKRFNPDNEEEIDETYGQHELHLEYADVFYRDLSAAKLFANNHFALCMDFQQNMPIPVTRVNKEFYLRQLWVYNFGIKNLKSGETTMFLYSETFAKKGANEVVSLLLWYINHVVPADATSLSVFCDNPTGQNKNRFVFSALQHLANTRFERVYMKFPVPGHSRMPIDADFGLIELKKRKMEQTFAPNDIVQMVVSSRTVIPFDVAFVNSPLTNDLCDNGTPVVVINDYKHALDPLFRKQQGGLDLNSIRELRFLANSSPIANFTDRFTSPAREVHLFSGAITAELLSQKFEQALPVYDDFLPISLPKVSNLETLVAHIPMGPEMVFFDTLYGFGEDGYRKYVRRS